MIRNKYILAATAFFVFSNCFSQTDLLPSKVTHAEPLFSDLVRDLGARKGEQEWNLGAGITRDQELNCISSLVEYEFAPVNRLGFEIEIPFVYTHTFSDSIEGGERTECEVEGLKLATQFTYFVSERYNLSLAAGYVHEFEFIPFSRYRSESMFSGNQLHPFVVAAKKWGMAFHTMIIAGPEWELQTNGMRHHGFTLDLSAHYMLPSVHHFVGIEWNNEWSEHGLQSIIRPQMRVVLSSTIKLGLAVGIPVAGGQSSCSFFTRLIYEPKGKLFSKK